MASTGQKRFRIYTRTGDEGTSSLYTGKRLYKDHLFFEAMGDVDELNSCLGICREWVRSVDQHLASQLATIQSRLIDVGAALATPADAPQGAKVTRTRFEPEHTNTLEDWLDAMDDSLPALTQFILPSGGHASASLHAARSVCRRAERSVIALTRALEQPASLDGAALQVAPTLSGVPSDDAVSGTSVGESGGDAGCCTTDSQVVVDPAVRVFLNRLSDYLFTAARYMAHKQGFAEQTYQKSHAA